MNPTAYWIEEKRGWMWRRRRAWAGFWTAWAVGCITLWLALITDWKPAFVVNCIACALNVRSAIGMYGLTKLADEMLEFCDAAITKFTKWEEVHGRFPGSLDVTNKTDATDTAGE